LGLDLTYDLFDSLIIGHIRSKSKGSSTVSLDEGRGLRKLVGGTGQDSHCCSSRGQGPGNNPPQASPTPGDQGDLTSKVDSSIEVF
jgi:hypothetical protein